MISEPDRLSILAEHSPDSLMDDTELAAICAFAAELCETPIALVSLVEEERQRFLARTGLDVSETPRPTSFCQYAMRQDNIMEVPDAREDPQFRDNPLVTGGPFIRFYAGAPIVSREGAPLGSLCVISPEPREGLTPLQRQGLLVLAQTVMRRLEDRRSARESEQALSESRDRFDALADSIPQMAWSTPPDGLVDYFNARWYEFTGAKPGDHFDARWIEALHPDDRQITFDVWAKAVATGEPYEVEYRMLRADGEYRWTLARGLPMKNSDGQVTRWFGTNTDIHESKVLVESQQLLSRELNHRIKNIFSLVGGLVSFSAREHSELAPLARSVTDRIAALGRAHHYVRVGDEAGTGVGKVGLRQLLSDLLEPYRDQAGSRIELVGEDLALTAEGMTPLALVFHELATNAVKYGALSSDDGRITVTVDRDGDDVLMEWNEHGGPALVEGQSGEHGFGSQLVDLSIRRQLGGSYERAWIKDGLKVSIRVPQSKL